MIWQFYFQLCRNFHIFSQWLHQFTLLRRMYKSSLSSTSIPILVIFHFLITAILTDGRGQLTVIWICVSWMMTDVEHSFLYLLIICASLFSFLFFFGEMSIQVLCPFFNWVVCFLFDTEFYDFLIYSEYYHFITLRFGNI